MKNLTYMQPITRVHNIFRIRTIVNSVTNLNKEKKFPRDIEIGSILADLKLSKFRKQKMKDRILRRARDHLLTAAYMGLLTRSGRPLKYKTTNAGMQLQEYKIDSECPKDEKEEAVFIDKLMRMKLTNIYDLQIGKQYLGVRSRPCLYILYVLKSRPWLHEHQIAIALGCDRCDPFLLDKKSIKTLNSVSVFGKISKKNIINFYKKFDIKQIDKRNMTRNIRPLLDWCESVGLIESKEVEKITGRIYKITERGSFILDKYSKMIPLWYIDLGDMTLGKSALILFYQYAKGCGLNITEKLLKSKIRIGLREIELLKLVKSIEKDNGIEFNKKYSELKSKLDFTLEYDIPPENRKEIIALIKKIANIYEIDYEKIIDLIEEESIIQLKSILKKEHENTKKIITGNFSKKTKISEDPILRKISDLVPSLGILNQYRSDFEKEVLILLKLIEFNAIKYQGQLAERCKKTYIIRFFENNPDILIMNGIESLVECKSVGEWHAPLSDKAVQKEILIYQQHLPSVKSNSIIIIYEGNLDKKSENFLIEILDDAKDIVFVTKNFLINCIYKLILKEKLIKTIKDPRNYDAESRIMK